MKCRFSTTKHFLEFRQIFSQVFAAHLLQPAYLQPGFGIVLLSSFEGPEGSEYVNYPLPPGLGMDTGVPPIPTNKYLTLYLKHQKQLIWLKIYLWVTLASS